MESCYCVRDNIVPFNQGGTKRSFRKTYCVFGNRKTDDCKRLLSLFTPDENSSAKHGKK